MNVAIIGNSGHAYFANEGLKKFPEARLVAISRGGPDEEIDSGFVEAFPNAQTFDDYREILDATQLDVAVVSPRFFRHAEVSAYFLQRGVHVFCEKPLALDMDSLNRVKEAWRSGGAQLGLMMNLRYGSEYKAAHDAVASGAIGQIEHIYAQKSYKNFEKPDWMKERRSYGGTLPWIGAHAIDWVLWMYPGLEVERISARQTRGFNCGNGEMESSAYACLDFAGGGQAIISVDYLRPTTAPTHSDDRLRILGSHGSIDVSGGGDAVMINADGACKLPLEAQPSIFEDFLHSVAGETKFRQSIDEVWRLSELCIEVQSIADEGQ